MFGFLFLDETFPEKLFGRHASASAGVAVGGGAGGRVCKWIGKSKELLSAMTGVRALLRRAQSPMRRARKMAQVTNLPLDEDWTAMEDL